MKVKELSKERLFELLTTEKYFAKGQFGILTIHRDSLYKIHYKTLIDTFLSKDINHLDNEIDLLCVSSLIYRATLSKEKFERIERTSSRGLITNVLAYRGIIVGIEMTYLKGYITLTKAKNLLDKEALTKVLCIVWTMINELLNNDIVPYDIKEDNVMINMNSLEVKLIDLDDAETKYGYLGYVKNYPYNRRRVTTNFIKMCKRLNCDS